MLVEVHNSTIRSKISFNVTLHTDGIIQLEQTNDKVNRESNFNEKYSLCLSDGQESHHKIGSNPVLNVAYTLYFERNSG